MGNIKNYTFNKLDFKLSNSDYWDFTLNSDAIRSISNYDDNLITSFNFSGLTSNLSEIISDVKWEEAISTNFSASTFGLTGLDNGFIKYEDTEFLSLLTGSTLTHTSNDDKMTLNVVSGATGLFTYPLTVLEDGNTTYLRLCGGFLQGYYKLDGYDYQVLPTRYENGFTISTWIRPLDCEVSGNTLNDLYPNNKGFFYYTGTRAENKFWNIFSGNTNGECTSGSTDMCTYIKETDIEINNIFVNGEISNQSVPLSPPPIDISLIENNFLVFGRSNGKVCGNTDSEDGFGQIRADHTYSEDNKYYGRVIRQKQVNFQNQFLTFGRSNGKVCGNTDSEDGFGQTRADHTYTGTTIDLIELDKNKDIIDNAIGFRIKDDGSIGYRLLTISGDCKSVEVVEEYSGVGMVTYGSWEHIVVKWVNNNSFLKCAEPRRGKYKFYVNSKLIFVSKELNEFIPKRLYDIQEKQIGVPYNISVGGGTQGLIESVTFDGQDSDDLGLMIEKNFAGTFIGDMMNFKLYNKNLSWCEIKDIYINKIT